MAGYPYLLPSKKLAQTLAPPPMPHPPPPHVPSSLPRPLPCSSSLNSSYILYWVYSYNVHIQRWARTFYSLLRYRYLYFAFVLCVTVLWTVLYWMPDVSVPSSFPSPVHLLTVFKIVLLWQGGSSRAFSFTSSPSNSVKDHPFTTGGIVQSFSFHQFPNLTLFKIILNDRGDGPELFLSRVPPSNIV